MGDRLTLETADGALVVPFYYRGDDSREMRVVVSADNRVDVEALAGADALGVWRWNAVDLYDDDEATLPEWVEMVACALAWAYRGRLPPARRKAPAVVPRDYITAREQLPRLVGAILNPNGEQEAYCLDSVGMMSSVDACVREVERLRGPTEGASDADVLRDELRRAYGVSLGEADDGSAFMPPRPPAGEASPDTGSSSSQQTKLGALIGAVEDDAGLVRSWAENIESTDEAASSALCAVASRLRVALAAAKGDAPTECECGPGARFDEVNQVCLECRRPLGEDAPAATSSPAPQVPDSPAVQHAVVTHVGETPMMPNAEGVWVQGGVPVLVEYCDGMGGLSWRDIETKLWRPVLDGADWGGRCTRDAPAAPAVGMRVCAKCESDTCPGRDVPEECTVTISDDGLRARAEAAWAAFENDDGFDGSLRGAQLADRLRKALDGS